MVIHPVNAQLSPKYVDNELIIWLQPGVNADEFSSDFSQDVRPKRVLSKRLNIWLFEFSNGNTQRSARMNNLRLSDNVKYVQNNHIVTQRAITPDDEHYGQQWAPAKIQLPDVWDEYTTGGTSADGDDIVIAVIDGGFDLAHEDLNFRKNTNETPNNGIDDDNNGYIDDFDGWNAYNSTGNIPNNDHGTHVTGIAGAIGNNDTGISGVNWNVNILPVAGSSGTEAIVVEAYSYILEIRALYNETNGQSGAFVVVTNSSFGVDQGDPDDFPIWCSMYDELGSEGILNCAATANANWNIDQVGDVPTACSSEFLIAVTNTNSNDNKATNAGYGVTHIDLGAPGTNIYSTLPGNNYDNLSGTSMATPHVAGVIALMYASMCQNMIQEYKSDPENFALLVRQHLFEGADNISSLNGLVAHGRLNALGAIEYTLGTSASISGPTIVCSSTNSTFTLNNRPTGTTVNWTKSSNLEYVSGQNTDYYTVRANATASGPGWVHASLNSACSGLTYSVWVGSDLPNPVTIDIRGEYGEFVEHTGNMWELCPNSNYYLRATPSDINVAWDWSLPESWELLSAEDSPEILIQTGDYIMWEEEAHVDVFNYNCGTWIYSAAYILTDESPSCGELMQLMLYPNPASNNVEVELISSNKKNPINKCAVSIIDNIGTIYYSSKETSTKFTLPVNNLRNGKYLVVVSDGKTRHSKTLIVNHN